MKNLFKKSWQFILIALVILIFFWKYVFKGLVPLPADITIGMYYPWLDYKWGYIVGVPVKNPFLSDVISQFYPFKIYAMDLVRKGIIPLWNPSLFGGYPLMANIQIGILNPTNLLFLVFSNTTAWSIQTMLQPFFAILFTYLFLRSCNLNKISSVLGGIIYAFSGFNLIWMQLNIHGFATAFLPLLLYASNKYFKTKRIAFGLLISIAFCLQIFSGYPQITIYSSTVVAIFILINFNIFKKEFVYFLFFIFLGFALSAIQILPTLELFLNSQRRLEIISPDKIFLPYRYIVSFFAPDYFGNPVTSNYWGIGDYSTICGYCGIISIILAQIGVFYKKEKKVIRFLLATLLFSLFFVFPNPFSRMFYRLNIVGLGSSAASRILFLTNFSVSCLAAFGFDLLSRSEFKRKYLWVILLPLLVITFYLITTILILKDFNYIGNYLNKLIFHLQKEIIFTNLSVGLRNLIFPGLILAAATLTLSMFLIKRKIIHKFALVLLFLLLVGEIFRFGWKFLSFSKKEFVFPKTPVISYLQQKTGIFRIEGGDAIPMNMITPYGFDSISAYDPMYPLRIAEFISLIDGGTITIPKDRYAKIGRYDSALLDLSNICYIFSLKRDDNAIPDVNGKIYYMYRIEKLRSIFTDKSVAILENKKCFPRAFFIREYLVEKDKENIAKILKSGNINLAEKIILEEDPDIVFNNDKSLLKEDKLNWRINKPGFNEITVEIKSPAFLFLSESFYPGWKVLIDGTESKIFRADYVFKAVYISEGKHKINFIYDPLLFKIGSTISFLSLIGIFIVFIKIKLG